MAFRSKPKNINRLVWNDSFSNDKRLNQNKPLKKCKFCGKPIKFKKINDKWFPMEKDGETYHFQQCNNLTKPKQDKKKFRYSKNSSKPVTINHHKLTSFYSVDAPPWEYKTMIIFIENEDQLNSILMDSNFQESIDGENIVAMKYIL